ncbi:MAG: NAD(P)-dependent alcohol dehydrogenase [Deltaproteobacteria bacterium]|nr:NAD(P)-dependent alcohol dehydrogenase [Deltaproteobacteria bacterium]
MTALVATGYGSPDVLELTSTQRPTPKDNEILIQVHATNVTAADSMMRRGDPAYARLFLGLMKPKAAIGGTGLAGVVKAVGEAITDFKVGDEVFGETGLSFGAHAEYVCVPEDGVILPKPAHLSFEDASAMCDGPMTSYNFLRRMADVQPGQKVLVNGASGALGTAAVQLAKAYGAEVTGVCSTANVALVKSLGADNVIDYTDEDFTQNPGQYDVIYDTVGKSSFRRCKKALTSKGLYMSPVLSFGLLLMMLWTKVFGSKSAKFDATGMRPAPELRAYLKDLITMTETGKLHSVIERTYRLDQIIEAHAHVDSGHKKGTVIVRMG